MWRFIILITLFFFGWTFAATTTDRLLGEGRIVGGEDTTIEKHPHQVSLQISGNHFCGGSIISPTIVITAAHCLTSYSASSIQVRLGSTDYTKGGELIAADTLVVHKSYDRKTMIHDVGLIKLKQSVPETNYIRYIQLAERTPPTGTKAVITGWGTKCYKCWSIPTILQEATVDIVSRKDCASRKYRYGKEIKETMVCAYAPKKDSCQGDSGGPLVVDNRLVGLVSWGRGCATKHYPGVYADVASLKQWIQQTMASLT